MGRTFTVLVPDPIYDAMLVSIKEIGDPMTRNKFVRLAIETLNEAYKRKEMIEHAKSQLAATTH